MQSPSDRLKLLMKRTHATPRKTGVVVLVGFLMTACARGQSGGQHGPNGCASGPSIFSGPSALDSRQLPDGILSGVARYLLKPEGSLVVYRARAERDVAFVLFGFQEQGKADRGFGVFVRRGNGWIADQVATSLWPNLPTPCSGRFPLISLTSRRRSGTAGFIDPTIDRLEAVVGSRLVSEDHPTGGAVLVLAPVGAQVRAYRTGTLVWSAEVRNIQGPPSP
jgi:hypothetical protein